MQSGEDLLIELLEKALASFASVDAQKRALAFDNAEYKIILANFISPGDIVKITDIVLKKLVTNLEPEAEQSSFMATIKFLRGLAELNKDKNPALIFNEKQLLIITQLKELLARTIHKNDFLISVLNDKSGKTSAKYQEVLSLIKRNELIKATDYDLIEEIVHKLCANDADKALDKIMTYLNDRNCEKLKKIYAEANPEVLPKEPAKNLPEPEAEVHTEINLKLNDFIKKSRENKPKKVLSVTSKEQQLKELIAYLGFDYDSFDIAMKNSLLAIAEFQKFKEFIYYLKDKNPIIIKQLQANNLAGLIYILTESNQTMIEKVLQRLTYIHNVSDETLTKIINLMTPIFGEKAGTDFLANSPIFEENKCDLALIVNEAILLLVMDNEELKRILTITEKFGANNKYILEKCGVILTIKSEVLINNLEVLEMYGFNLAEFFAEKESCYPLLNNVDLAAKLDQFIEVGLNEYIHTSPSFAGNAFRTLIIKRIYYAFKNGLPFWTLPNTKNEFINPKEAPLITSETHSELIENSDYVISESDISLLIAEYPLIEVIDEAHRPTNYSSAPLAFLKRKTELLFGNKIISRLKTYRVFKLLVESGVNEEAALLEAITYKSLIDESEYAMIKEITLRLGATK